MKRLSVVWAGLFLLAACQDTSRSVGPEAVDASLSAASAGQAEMIVLLDPAFAPGGHAQNQATARAVAAEFGITPRHAYGTAVFGFSGVVPEGRLQGLERDPRVVHVEAVEAWPLAVDFASLAVAQALPTGIDRIETDKNPHADIDGIDDVRVGLDVAILDTGIDQDHPDLNVAGGRNFSGGSTSNWDDGNGHGTHVAGTVGALDNGDAVVGVAPGVRVWGYKVCKNGGICMTGDMVAGIDFMTNQKSSGSIDFVSANFSIGSADEDFTCGNGNPGAVHQAVCAAVDAGIVFALAAGNEGRAKSAFPEAFVVGAIADFDGVGGGAGAPTCRTDVDDTYANFSNWTGSSTGPVDIAAPGVCILSTWNDGGTNTISGTSMATPHATGAVALYLHANGLSPATSAAGVAAIEDAIRNAAHDEGTGTEPCSYDNERGTSEPLLFVNATAFGGDGTCEVATGGNATPTVTITSPADGASFGSGATIDFAGSATDDEDGDLTADLVWTSSIDGEIGAGGSFSTSLSDGTHTITAEATDFDGATGSDQIQITVGDEPPPPADVTVTAIEPNSMNAGTTIPVTITGSGFAAGASVTFENGSGPAPEASNVVVVSSTQIDATVTAKSGGPPGSNVWDVRVTNTDSSTGVLVDGFTVTR